MIKKVAIITNGGDAPGLNTVIRAIVKTAETNGIECYGYIEGYKGLLENNYIKLESNGSASGLLHRGGTIIGTVDEGAYLTGGYGYFKGGTFIGQKDGIVNYGTSFLGTKGENLSITSPEARGINGYGFNNNGYMNFYDGILKGKKKDGIANSSHNGMIQRVEDATQVKRDYEYINNVYYETEYLETQGDWLEIEGKGKYNTVDKACAAATSGDTIKVIADTHIAFDQHCESGKVLTFDENGVPTFTRTTSL